MIASLMGHFQYLVCENLWRFWSCICNNFWVNGWKVFFPSSIEVTTVETNYWIQFQFLTECETCSACDYCSGFWFQVSAARGLGSNVIWHYAPSFRCEAIMPSADWSFIYAETLKCLLRFLSSRNEKTSGGIKGSQTLSLNNLLKSFLHSIPWPQRSCCQGLTCWHQHSTGSNSCFCPDSVSLSFKSHRDLSPPLELPSQS